VDWDHLLVLATTGGRPIESVAGPILKNARVATFLTFDEALPVTSVLVTNGGYGTVPLDLSAGVRIVSAGKTEDKAEVNARVLVWAGVDSNSTIASVDAIRSAISKALTQPSYASRACSLANDFKTLNADEDRFAIVARHVN